MALMMLRSKVCVAGAVRSSSLAGAAPPAALRPAAPLSHCSRPLARRLPPALQHKLAGIVGLSCYVPLADEKPIVSGALRCTRQWAGGGMR